jgi:hypothetical protein
LSSYLSAKNQLIMKKIKSFKIKDCKDCFYWQSEENINQQEFCAFHEDKEDQPLEIIKQIREKRKEWKTEKILNWLYFLITGSVLFLSFSAFNYFSELALLSTGAQYFFKYTSYCVIFRILLDFILGIFSFSRRYQEFRQETKELNQKKREWIIEYE